jgi:hypothetical protein
VAAENHCGDEGWPALTVCVWSQGDP